MARWPAPGRCKQRLASGLGNRRAAQIQERLCAHTLATANRLAHGHELVLAISGLGAQAARRWAQAMASPRWVLQGPGPLGVRMQRQLTRAWREGAHQVVLIGSDLPTLEAPDLAQAFALLDDQPMGGADLVLGPASDGGYWLIGLALDRQKRRGMRSGMRWGMHQGMRRGGLCQAGLLLAGIPWGSNQVLAATLERARQWELRVALLNERSDVDWPQDLRRWRQEWR